MDLPGGTQMCVPGTRQQCHRPRYEKILDGYDRFNTYVVINLFRATDNFGNLDVRSHVMTLEASIVVSRLSYSNKYYGSIINFLCTVST